ncbi:MAG: ECF-type sigma factor [Pseudomonadota bacterium]|nr:ECF-type sigma factor [Pseudomonadota bacterium]
MDDQQGLNEAHLARDIRAADAGDASAVDQLFAALYAELHRMAKRQLHRNAYGSTLGATTLLHEAYVDLSGRNAGFPDRARFFAYTARAMRGLIIDHVRERRAQKRGGEFHLTALSTQVAESVPEINEMTALNEALNELAGIDAPLAELVDLKFFCGFSFNDIAAMRGVSERTVQRDWNKARMYLRQTLHDD